MGGEGAHRAAHEDIAGDLVAAGESLANEMRERPARGRALDLSSATAQENNRGGSAWQAPAPCYRRARDPAPAFSAARSTPPIAATAGSACARSAPLGLDEMWWLVSPGNPLKPAQGMAPLPARLASARRRAPRPADPGHRDRARARHPLHRRYARRAAPPLYPDRRFIWLMGADNLAQFHRWTALAQNRHRRCRLRSLRGRDMMALPTRLAPWAGCGASSGPRPRLGTGRSGDRRHSCS